MATPKHTPPARRTPLDDVDEASIASFPASDPPSTQPLHTGAPARDASPSAAAPFEQALRVAAADLDEREHVNNVVYLRWVQDAATAHWHSLAPAGAAADVAWVALRHEIDYLQPAVLGDALTVRTWVGDAEGLRFERFTEVRRVRDELVLVRARTLWCPVDMATGRPRRVDAAIRAIFSNRAVP